VGFVFQNPDDQLFSPTVAQDVAFGPVNMGLDEEEVESRVEGALRAVGMDGYGDVHPSRLSGGEKRRVCLAGVLAMRPEVLVLDEPTSDLDPRGTRDIISLINNLRKEKGITVVVSTHDVNLIPHLTERVAVIHEGCLLFIGDIREAFGDMDLLTRASLEPPEVTKLVMELEQSQNSGHSNLPLTVEEAKEYLIRLRGG
jgi:cobalt/nickel transport system ATP-binding protein